MSLVYILQAVPFHGTAGTVYLRKVGVSTAFFNLFRTNPFKRLTCAKAYAVRSQTFLHRVAFDRKTYHLKHLRNIPGQQNRRTAQHHCQYNPSALALVFHPLQQLKQQHSNSVLVICKGKANELFDTLLVAIQARIDKIGYPLDFDTIGSIAVVSIDEESETLEIGYCISRRFWGQGVTAEAAKALISALFKNVGAKRIIAKHDLNNPNSGRVMRKAGMHYLRTEEGKYEKNGCVYDAVVYHITAQQWKDQIS